MALIPHDLTAGRSPEARPRAVALGVFDGLHRGHRAVIEAAVAAAHADGMSAAVLTFIQPVWVLPKGAGAARLLSDRGQAELPERWGADEWWRLDFDAVRDLSPEAFVREVLVGQLHAHTVCCGFNYRFGKGGCGDTAMLSALGAAHGLTVRVADAVFDGGQPISSSRIRAAVEAGDMDTAARLLGREFTLDFPVTGGHRRGRGWGFPTLNQPFPPHFVLPRFGVYASTATVDGTVYPAVTNVGVHPTVGCADAPLAETYVFGFDGDLYGRAVPVALTRFLREEQKFPDEDALREQVDRDRQAALRVWDERGVDGK